MLVESALGNSRARTVRTDSDKMASSSNEPAPSFSDLDKDQVRHHAMALQDKSLALFDAVSTTQKALQECARQLSTIKAPNNLTSEEEIFFTTFKNLGDGLSRVAAELSNCRSQVPNASDISNDLDIALRTAQGHKQTSKAKLDAAEREVAKISAAKDQLLKKFGVKAGQNPSSSSFKLILDKTDQRLALALAKRNELVRSQVGFLFSRLCVKIKVFENVCQCLFRIIRHQKNPCVTLIVVCENTYACIHTHEFGPHSSFKLYSYSIIFPHPSTIMNDYSNK